MRYQYGLTGKQKKGREKGLHDLQTHPLPQDLLDLFTDFQESLVLLLLGLVTVWLPSLDIGKESIHGQTPKKQLRVVLRLP